jgi:hypothetical protein
VRLVLKYHEEEHEISCEMQHTLTIQNVVKGYDKDPMSLRLTALVFCPDRWQSRACVGLRQMARAGDGCS